MNGLIGCYGLIGIAIFIIGLAIWSRRKRQGVREFYKNYSLTAAAVRPESVRTTIGIPDPMCLSGRIKTIGGEIVPFYWWEWSSTSFISTGNGVQGSLSCYLAVSFPPNTVSKEFEQTAIAEKEAKIGFLNKLMSFYVLNTKKPIRIEKPTDGSFVIFWQILQRPEVMEDKITWLKQNLSVQPPFPH